MAKILAVDDDKVCLTTLEFDLQDEGHEVVALEDGNQVIQKASEIKPDLILLDINLRGVNGLDVLAQLKQDPFLKDVPVILLSGATLDDVVIRGLDLGAHDYVSKPYHGQVLAARMRSALRLRQALMELALANSRLTDNNRVLKELATTDSLTGLLNRRSFWERANNELARAWREHIPVAVVMLDVDFFKKINDQYGHPVGDRVLTWLGDLLTQSIRPSDLAGRIGGEEFVLLFPNMTLAQCLAKCDRLRQTVEEHSMDWEGIKNLKFTVSVGVTELLPRDRDIAAVVSRADEQLYLAKESGRNRVVAA